jgi:hypothetical protein
MSEVKADDSKWRNIVQAVAELAHLQIKVGVLDGAGESDEGVSLVEIAACNELGTEHIPERSFIRSTFAAKQDEAARVAKKIASAIIRGTPADVALELLGQWGAAAVKRTITSEDIPPPLAQSTIDAKGSSKPLVDTGQLVNSITYVVEDV